MKMIFGLEHAQEPVEGFDALMRPIRFIVDAPWGSVRDENIEGTPIVKAIEQ